MYAFRCSRARLFGANGSYETVQGPEGNDGRPRDTAHGSTGHGARLDELTPSFSTDIITCTRTVLTTDDPPLVTFFLSHGINACLPRSSRLSPFFTSPLLVCPRCLASVAPADRFFSLTLLYETTPRFSRRIATATKHTHDISQSPPSLLAVLPPLQPRLPCDIHGSLSRRPGATPPDGDIYHLSTRPLLNLQRNHVTSFSLSLDSSVRIGQCI